MPSFGVVTGVSILLHAIYSSYEWVSLNKLVRTRPTVRISKDVLVEIMVGLVFIVVSSSLSGVSKLQPIKVSNLNSSKTLSGEEPYAYLETRPNFQDLVGRRRAYLQWKKESAADINSATEKDSGIKA